MATVTASAPYTFEDFCTLVREDQKADLIDGIIYMASPESLEGNKLFVWLLGVIDDFVEMKDLGGDVYGSRVAFRINDTNGPEPDIGYLRKERAHLRHRGFVGGAPDVAIEIVSPESVERNYVKKRAQYERAGVPEYWIVDPLKERVTLLRRARDGQYREARPQKGAYHSRVLPGFWLRPEWLWKTPRPKKAKVLKQILAGLA